jgi:hypothetical protein
MKNWFFPLLVTVVPLLFGCDVPQQSNTQEVRPVRTDRYADFNDVVVEKIGRSGGDKNQTWRINAYVRIEPTRVGAYLIEGENDEMYRIYSGAEHQEPTTQPTDYGFEFSPNSSKVKVTFSDGKTIERTVVETH